MTQPDEMAPLPCRAGHSSHAPSANGAAVALPTAASLSAVLEALAAEEARNNEATPPGLAPAASPRIPGRGPDDARER